MSTTLPNLLKASLLAFACGDALGAPKSPPNSPPRTTHHTAMMLGLAESYLRDAGMLRIQTLLDAWLTWYHSPRYLDFPPDAASHQALTRLANGYSFLDAASPSPSNAPAARAVPTGLLFALEPTIRQRDALSQAALTHDHPEAAAAAVLMAEAVAFLVRTQARPFSRDAFLETLHEACLPLSPALAATLHALPATPRDVSNHSLDTLPAALSLFLQHRDDLPRALTAAATAGGETHPLAALVGALSGAYLGLDALPEAWIAALDQPERLERAARGLGILASARWTYLEEGER